MTFDQNLTDALRSSSPFQEARLLAQRYLHEGESKQAVLDRFAQARKRLREQGSETDEDIVCDVMDCLVGWCGSHMRLDEPE